MRYALRVVFVAFGVCLVFVAGNVLAGPVVCCVLLGQQLKQGRREGPRHPARARSTHCPAQLICHLSSVSVGCMMHGMCVCGVGGGYVCVWVSCVYVYVQMLSG
jgi:hypothetical protein